jgi:hypothetical protein
LRIVNIQDLMAQLNIRAEVHRYQSLMFNETLDCIRWLAKRRLLRNSVLCQTCQIPMSFVRKMDLTDGYRWKCKTSDQYSDRLPFLWKPLITPTNGWAKGYAQKDIAREAKLGQHSTHTKVDWCAFCLDFLNDDMTSKVIEIDESKFFHRKYHRGQGRTLGIWRN